MKRTAPSLSHETARNGHKATNFRRNGRAKAKTRVFVPVPLKPTRKEEIEENRRLVAGLSNDAIKRCVAKMRSRPSIDDEE